MLASKGGLSYDSCYYGPERLRQDQEADRCHQCGWGDVVCIEYGKKLTYDVTYKVRLVDSREYGISTPDMLKGFLSGLHAGNFDITNVFIDNLYKTIGCDKAAAEEFVSWCAKFAADNNMEITMTISEDPANASEAVKQYL